MDETSLAPLPAPRNFFSVVNRVLFVTSLENRENVCLLS